MGARAPRDGVGYGLSVEKDVCLIKAPLEGGAIVHYNGLYYALGSALTGWRPNPNKYATAPALEGPLVRVQRHRSAGDQHLRLPIHHVVDGARDENNHRHLYRAASSLI